MAGCAAVMAGPICAGPEASVQAWIALAPGEQIAGATPVIGGARVTLTAPGTIEVAGRLPLKVGFGPAPESAGRAHLAAGRAAWRAGRPDDAVAELTRAGAALAKTDASGAALSAQVLSFVHLEAGRLQAARAALDAAKPPAEDGGARGMHAYFEALAVRAAGDAGGALRALKRADLWTERLALPLGPTLVEARAMTHVELGRVAEAVAALQGLMTSTTDVCRRADLLANLGWALMLSDQADADATGGALDAAVEAFAACDRASPNKRANARLNAALWASVPGRSVDASVVQVFEVNDDSSPELRGWARLLAARLTPVSGQAEAFDAVVGKVADAGLPHLHWRALLEAGQAWTPRDPARAQRRFEQAEALVDADTFRLPVDAGRGAFAGGRWASTAHLVDLFVQADRPVDAMRAARRARRRVLTTLPTPQAVAQLSPAQRDRWDAALTRYRQARSALAADAARDWERPASEVEAAAVTRAAQSEALSRLLNEALGVLASRAIDRSAPLRAPAPGEASLTWTRRPDGGWWVLVQDAAGAIVRPVVGTAWTQPVLPRLAQAERIVVLALGPSAEAPLDLAGRPHAYGLDLPPRALPEAGTGASIVADPTGDLPSARREADRVTTPLKARFGDPTRLAGAAARRDAVRAALRHADHLHYAGHGDFSGQEGWSSALRLSDGPLTLADVLLLPRVPRTVVLSACETGRADDARAAGVGLAHALLIRGAATVVAPTTAVDDRDAAAFSAALYAAWRPKDPLWMAFAVVAHLEAARSYRVFVP